MGDQHGGASIPFVELVQIPAVPLGFWLLAAMPSIWAPVTCRRPGGSFQILQRLGNEFENEESLFG